MYITKFVHCCDVVPKLALNIEILVCLFTFLFVPCVLLISLRSIVKLSVNILNLAFRHHCWNFGQSIYCLRGWLMVIGALFNKPLWILQCSYYEL